MKLYEVRRFSSENEKRAVEYVKEYTKEAYTQKYRYTPEVLKLDDGRTKYTLRIKAKQVATACKYLMAYFGEEIQNLSSIVADILANDPKATDYTIFSVFGEGYSCDISVCDDAGNTHISLYLDAEASEESNPEETETQTETNEAIKEESVGEGVKFESEIDDEAPVKVFSSYEEYKTYFDKLPIRRVPMLIHKGDVLAVDVAVKADDLDAAIRHTLEIYADYPAITDAVNAIREEVDRGRKCHSSGLIKWSYIKSDTRGYMRYRIMLDVAVEEPEEAQNSDDVHETNARLEIVKLKDARFGTPHLYKSVTGYAFYDAKKGGYWAYSADRDKHGILAPYTPCGGREALEKILSDGGFVSFEGMEVVKPLE